MVQQNQSQDPIPTKKGRNPGLLWVLGWTVLTTAAIPVALIGMPPVAAAGIWLSKLGVRAGVWAAPVELRPGGVRYASLPGAGFGFLPMADVAPVATPGLAVVPGDPFRAASC